MTEDEIRRLLELKSEGPNLDYKAGFEWNKPNRDLKYELVRDLMALANTKDGGRIVFGVRDDDFEFTGVSREIVQSIDLTSVLSMLHDNSAPQVRCGVYKQEIDGRCVIVFDVAEFDEIPIICTNSVTDANKRLILRQGAIYIRTAAGSTEEMSSPDDSRSLITRAVSKKSAELLRAFNDILTGRPARVEESAAVLYAPEIQAAEAFLESQLGFGVRLAADALVLKSGHWELLAYPTVYSAIRIPSIPGVKTAVAQSEVSLRGWNFPHTDGGNAVPFANGFQSTTIGSGDVEGYRASRSGLFLWKRVFWEDTQSKKGDKGRPLLSFISAIYSFTEILIFLSRFYEGIAPDASVRCMITLRGCKGRQLAAMNPRIVLGHNYISHEDVISQEREVQVAQLRASHIAIAADMSKYLFHVFGWLNPDDTMIANWQQQLLKRQF